MNRTRLSTDPRSQGLSVEKAIASRRSFRDFSGRPMPLETLSHVLQYTCGMTDTRNRFRAAPSAGATYPIEVYPVVNHVEGLARGAYHYLVATHELETLSSDDFRQEIVRAAAGQKFLALANVVLVLTAVYHRTTRTYGDRGRRYVHFEAGHIAQNASLVATALGLGSCAVGAFYEGDFNRMLGMDGKNETALYLIAIGMV
jgi:SagB-type dehydrogenase family enzyme